jgi:glycosyltransferase involved in cell wall biosynthesis
VLPVQVEQRAGPEEIPRRAARDDAAGVEWEGLVEDRKVVRQHFARSSLFVMPSRCEPFGLVFLEAMAHKLPCIGADLDAMPEIIADGESGLPVQPEDERDLAAKIEALLNDPARLRAMGEAGFRRAQRYTWARVARDISAQLDGLVHRP